MAHDWKTLSAMTGGQSITVERVRLRSGVAIDGEFELPPLAQLPMEDQVFVAAFVRSHGSIKEMERLFGVSYPTVKNRLNRLSQALGEVLPFESAAPPGRADILDQLERGELTAQQAAEALKKC